MNNFALRQAKQQIIDLLNGLPYEIEAKRLLLRDIYEDYKLVADDAVVREMNELKKALEEKEKEDDTEGKGRRGEETVS